MPVSHNSVSIFRVIEKIYDAALAEHALEPILADICKLAGLDRGLIRTIGITGAPAKWAATHNVDEEFAHQHEQHFCHINAYAPYLPAPFPGFYWTTGEYSGMPAVRSSEYLNDFLIPSGFEYANAMVLDLDRTLILGAMFGRDRKRGDFTTQEKELFAILLPHVHRSCTVHRRLGETRSERDATLATMDRLSTGTLLLGANRKILQMNDTARRLCTHANGLATRRQRLTAVSADIDRKLQRALGAALDTGAGTDPQAGSIVSIPRAAPARPLSVMSVPLTGRSAAPLDAAARLLILIRNPDRSLRAARETLQIVFGLSPTEARIAAMIADGKTLQEAAATIGHSINTSRTLLKRIFRKTATSSQHELAAVVGKATVN